MKLILVCSLTLLLCLTACSALGLPTLMPTIALPPPGDLPSQTAAPAPAAVASPHATNTPPLPNLPLWVTNPVDGTILRIDPQTNAITATIRVEGHPAMAVPGAGGVWVLDRSHNGIFHIDPSSNQVSGFTGIPDGAVETLAVTDQAVWVGVSEQTIPNRQPNQEEGPTPWPDGWIVKIDPHTNKVLEQVDTGLPVEKLVVADETLWILARGPLGAVLQKMDLEQRQVQTVSLDNIPEWFLAEDLAVGSNLWIFSEAYSQIYRAEVNDTDGAPRAVASIYLDQRQPVGYASLMLWADSLWAATPWGSLMKIDPRTNHVIGQVDLQAPLSQLLASGTSVWATSQQTGQLFRIDPDSLQVTAQIHLGSPLQPTVIPTPTSRVVVWQPCPDAPASRL